MHPFLEDPEIRSTTRTDLLGMSDVSAQGLAPVVAKRPFVLSPINRTCLVEKSLKVFCKE
jgi:hypothetical protein